ncbi:MAG TPA: hypothetical protein VNQ48_01895 [Microbacteriaceae bacterium]|nr:hypothetical protein [Microbacteriaceae bacterium]
MARKQLSDIERLRREAEDLWEQQQDVLHQARQLARAAGRQGVDYAAPRIQQAVGSGANAVRSLADGARERVQKDVVPALTTALGSAIATIDAFRDRQLRPALTAIGRGQVPVIVQPAKPKPNVGLWVGLGIGIVAAAAVGYVVWQTLRADDDLWIEEELAEVPETTEG